MKNYVKLLVATLVVTLIMVGCNQEDEQGTGEGSETEGIATTAEEFIQLLSDGQYEEAATYFDETVAAELTPAALKDLWEETLPDQLGQFIDQEYASTDEAEGYRIVLINGLFEGADVVFRISFDDDEQIAGFFIQ